MKKILTVLAALMAFALSAGDVNQLTDAVGITWRMSAVSGAAPEWYTDIGVERFVKNDGSAYVTEISIPTTVTLLTVPSKLEWLSHGVAFSAYPVIKYLTRSATEGHPYITSVAVNRSVELEMPCFKNCPSLERFGLGNPPDWDSGEVREGSLYAVKDGVLYNGDMSELMKYPEGKLGAVFTVPASVVKAHQFSLVNMRLAGITFEGNAPEIIQDMDDSLETVSSTVVSGSSNLSKIFYHQDAFGWGRTWCGVQTQMILDPVTGLTATKGSRSDGVLLTWNGNEKASGYRIYRTEDESRIFLAEAWDTTWLDETADPKKTYWYDVEVLGGDDWGRACVSEPCQPTVGWAAEPTFEFSDVCASSDGGPSGVCLLDCTCAGGRLDIPSEHDGWPVIVIGSDACCYKHISAVTIPPSVRHIERSAFQGCSALTSVTIPSGVIGISANAFRFCRGLISIQVSEDNAAYSSLDGVLFSKDGTKLLIYPEGKNGPYDIPLAVKDIGDDAFNGCCGLTSVTIPPGVTSIGGWAFSNCSGLTHLLLPEGVTSIGEKAFADCCGLTSVTIPSSVTSIGGNAFYGCSEILGNGVVIVDNCVLTVNGTCPPNVVLPDGVRLIADEAFSSCGDLASMMMPESVTGIGEGAFRDCSGLTNIVLSSSLTNIEANVFNGCSGLTSVMIPSGVTSIGERAFANDSGLTHVLLPEGLRSVGSCAFQDCSGLTNIAIPPSVVSIGSSAFSGCSGLGEGVVIVDGCALTVNGGCPAEVTFPEGTRLISDYMFHDFDELSAVTLPSSVVNLGNGAFAGCSSLTKVTFAEGLTSIGDRAFMDCRHLPSIAIPSSVKNIGNYAFSGCTALASVTISEGVESLGECAFESCDSLTRVHLPSSLRSLGKGAFVICHNLIDVVFENGVTNIGDLAFWWCYELKSVTIPASVTEIGDMAFEECYELTDLTIPEGVERIGELAFFACDRLKTVTIPSSVTNIGNLAFGQSLGLRNLIFLGNAPSVSGGSYAIEASFDTDSLEGYDEGIVASVYTDAPEWDGCEDIVATVYADTTGWGEGDRWHGLILNRIERGSIVVRGKAACEIMPEGLETPLEVPDDWLIENGVAKEGDAVADVAVRMAETGANGIPRYQSYILNMVPDADVSAEDQLKVTIDFDANGVPVIGYKPTPNDASHVTVRTLGAKALGDDWVEVKGNEVDYKFFKVTVGVR